MFGTCCSLISTHYLERQTLLAFLSCAPCGWNFLLMKLLSAMMRLSWLEAVSWCKESTLRCYCNQIFFTYFATDFVVCPLFNIVSPLHLFNKFKFVVSSIQRAKYTSVYLPGKELWYDIRTGAAYKGGKTHKLEAKEESVPAFQRAGTIIPRKDRLRRSSTQMVNDPYTLVCS